MIKKGLMAIGIAGLITLACVNTEMDLGLCLNEQGDGMIYNADPDYNYISYRSTGAQTGDKVLTVLFKNPTNLAPDDYIYRNDWILERR